MGPVRAAALAVLAVGAALAPGPLPAPRTVVLTAHHSRFVPSVVEVPPGVPVRIVVRNADPIDHELIVGDAAVHRRHEHGREAHHHGEVPGEVSVPAGTTAATTYRFPAGATVTFGCHLPGHWDYGMRGVAVVRAA